MRCAAVRQTTSCGKAAGRACPAPTVRQIVGGAVRIGLRGVGDGVAVGSGVGSAVGAGVSVGTGVADTLSAGAEAQAVSKKAREERITAYFFMTHTSY